MVKYSVTDYLSMGEGVVAVKVAKVEVSNGYVTNILKRDKGGILNLTEKEHAEFSKMRDKTKAKVYLSRIANKVLKTK